MSIWDWLRIVSGLCGLVATGACISSFFRPTPGWTRSRFVLLALYTLAIAASNFVRLGTPPVLPVWMIVDVVISFYSAIATAHIWWEPTVEYSPPPDIRP